jgi:mono/diheme cytochrome c family protein
MLTNPHPSRALRRGGLLAALALVCTAALADGDQHVPRVPLLPRYQQECASCHVAYPPGMLPAASWRRIVDGLPQHHGTDASLDAATLQQLSAWLDANAATGRRMREAPPEDRITRSAWFVREHDEVSPATWKRPAVKSPANCAACHTRADQGEFRERDIHIPR